MPDDPSAREALDLEFLRRAEAELRSSRARNEYSCRESRRRAKDLNRRQSARIEMGDYDACDAIWDEV